MAILNQKSNSFKWTGGGGNGVDIEVGFFLIFNKGGILEFYAHFKNSPVTLSISAKILD